MKSSIFLVLALLLLLGLPACSKKVAQQDGGDVDYYTCTMHPSVKSKDPGKVPDLFDGPGAGDEKGRSAEAGESGKAGGMTTASCREWRHEGMPV